MTQHDGTPPGGGPWHWGAKELWARLEPRLPGLSVEVLARTASTNTVLLERARIAPNARNSGFDNLIDDASRVGRRQADMQPCLLVAEHQTGGRGRGGRGWRSARSASLTFSLALPLAPSDWSGLSLAVGIALADALQPEPLASQPRIALKWPNDLWLTPPADQGPPPDGSLGRKLGGILIETLLSGRQRLAVIGVGINIRSLPEPLPADLNGRMASLCELDAGATAPATLARIALPLVEALQTFERDGFAVFAGAFARRDLLAGHAVRTTDAQAPEGTARGVDARGALRVEAADGLHTITSGEVSVRPAASPDTIPTPLP
ncbi:MAG TPA: biotin--[acetyl-CoA-carboxylase] ligase [Burkholderiaceae bacterium]